MTSVQLTGGVRKSDSARTVHEIRKDSLKMGQELTYFTPGRSILLAKTIRRILGGISDHPGRAIR